MQQAHDPGKQFTIDLGNDEQGFDHLYTSHYVALFQYAYTMLNDTELAEEMVQQVFLKILEKKEPIIVRASH